MLTHSPGTVEGNVSAAISGLPSGVGATLTVRGVGVSSPASEGCEVTSILIGIHEVTCQLTGPDPAPVLFAAVAPAGGIFRATITPDVEETDPSDNVAWLVLAPGD